MGKDYAKMLDMSNPKGNVKQTGWGFIGVLGVGKDERQVPIGVYSKYRDGAASANAWLKSTPGAVRWEGEKLYEELEDE